MRKLVILPVLAVLLTGCSQTTKVSDEELREWAARSVQADREWREERCAPMPEGTEVKTACRAYVDAGLRAHQSKRSASAQCGYQPNGDYSTCIRLQRQAIDDAHAENRALIEFKAATDRYVANRRR